MYNVGSKMVGYARVSTKDQNLELQLDALNKAGCEKIFTDKISGAKEERPGLKEMLEWVRKGDTIVIWKIDRLARTLKQLIEIVNQLNENGIELKILTQDIDTRTIAGKLFFHLFGAFAEFEREQIRERVKAGIVAARARGKNGGRPKAINLEKAIMAKKLWLDPTNSISKICRILKISRTTFYKYLNKIKDLDIKEL